MNHSLSIIQASDIERHRKRFESNCVVTKLKDSNNSAVIASGLFSEIFSLFISKLNIVHSINQIGLCLCC